MLFTACKKQIIHLQLHGGDAEELQLSSNTVHDSDTCRVQKALCVYIYNKIAQG